MEDWKWQDRQVSNNRMQSRNYFIFNEYVLKITELFQGHINLGLEDETKPEINKHLAPSVKFRIAESVKSAFKDNERDLTEEEKQK